MGPFSEGEAPLTATKLCEPLLECSLPAALGAMGKRWPFLILRGAFNGLHHFEFQSALGIARNILARTTMAADRRKVEYVLTEKGHARCRR